MQREKQTEWLADLFIKEADGGPMVIFGTSFKPETNITTGSPALLLKNIIEEKGYKVTTFDPYVDDVDWTDQFETLRITYFIGTQHRSFKYFPFKQNSTIIDPFRYIANRNDLKIIKIGDSIER